MTLPSPALPPLRRPGVSLRDWFRFADRAGRHPVRPAEVQTHKFTSERRGEPRQPGWEFEEWSVRAFLVPLRGLAPSTAARRVRTVVRDMRAHDLEFGPSWFDARTFDFAEGDRLGAVPVQPWLRTWPHPITEALVIEPRDDFVRYHALDVRRAGPAAPVTEYVHPRDGIAVLRTAAESAAWYDPAPTATVHRDYLRDYLAARGAALVVATAADRFAAAPTVAGLELEDLDEAPVRGLPAGEAAWRTTTMHPPDGERQAHAWGRSTLHWNVVVLPYDAPKPQRSPWASGRAALPTGGPLTGGGSEDGAPAADPLPTFIVSGEGEKAPSGARGAPAYLFFRPAGLEKYLGTPGYGVAFHMRTWGQAFGPGDATVDVGINSRGLATAYAPDVARLTPAEQLHWAHHSSLPDGEVCRALFETRMQQRPPHEPGVADVIGDARGALDAAFAARFGLPLYTAALPRGPDLQRMGVGPVRGDPREVVDLAKSLYAWAAEAMQVPALRSALDRAGATYEKTWKQFALLRALLVATGGLADAAARERLTPLDALNDLRVRSAHALADDLDTPFRRLGYDGAPSTPRAAWDALVDAVADTLRGVAAALAPASA